MKSEIVIPTLLFLVFGGFLAFAVIGTDTDSQSSQSRVQGVSTPDRHSPNESADQLRLPDITLQQTNGDAISLAEYVGEKPVVLDFWASWCHNCQRDMPKLSKMYDQYRDQIEVLGINLNESSQTIDKFADAYNINFPLLADPDGAAAVHFGIRYTNIHLLFRKDGTFAKPILGDITEEDIVELLEA